MKGGQIIGPFRTALCVYTISLETTPEVFYDGEMFGEQSQIIKRFAGLYCKRLAGEQAMLLATAMRQSCDNLIMPRHSSISALISCIFAFLENTNQLLGRNLLAGTLSPSIPPSCLVYPF